MFLFAYDNYIAHALPLDNLKPISCSGSNAQGGVAFTLLDSLDSLILLGQHDRLQQALAWLDRTDSLFNVDQPGHVFELTIRAMGGLLSSHIALMSSNTDRGSSNNTNTSSDNNSDRLHWSPVYNGELLQLAEDLARRLLPAFNTLTGLPTPFVNLKHGAIQNQDRSTCTACAGTLYLEWATLSMLTGDSVYQNKAKEALVYLHKHRSRERGLVGNTINVDTGIWTREDGGIGAGIDSYYEYLLKGYLLTGDEDLLEMFSEEYAAVTTQLQLPHIDLDRGSKSESDIDSQYGGGVYWLLNANMHSGKLEHGYIWSVSAFWPALQILAGQVEDAKVLHQSWMQAWKRWGEVGLPEMFEIHLGDTHPSMASYPLRPELIESTYMLYGVTGDEELLQWGAKVLKMFEEVNKVKCGYAHVEDVGRRKKKRKRDKMGGSVGDEGEHSVVQLQDDMESFFLSETLKYLYLLFSMEDGAAVVDEYVLTTEAHFLPPFVDDNNNSSSSSSRNEEEEDSAGEMTAMTKCQEVCLPTTTNSSIISVNQLLLRQRRCKACLKVNKAMEAAKKEQSKEGSATDNSKLLESVKALLVRGREVGVALQQQALTASGRRLIKQFLVSLSPTSSSNSGDDLPPSPATTIPHHDTTTSIEEEEQQQASSVSSPPPSSSQQIYGPSTIEEVPPLKPSEKWLDELPSNYVIVQVSEVPPSSFSKDNSNSNGGGGSVHSNAQMISVVVHPGGSHDRDSGDTGVWEVLGIQGDIGQPLDGEGENDGRRRRRIVKGRAILAYPIQACTPLTWNPTLPTGGSIVIVARGSCSFSQKLHYAKKAGAVAMIVVSNEEWLMPMGHSPDERYEEDDGDNEDATDSNGNRGDGMPVAVLLPKSQGIAVAELVEMDLFLELELATIPEQAQPSSLSEKTIETADTCPLNDIFEEEDVDDSNSSSSSEMCCDNNATKQQQQQKQQEHTFYLEMMVPAKSQGWLAQRLQNQQLNLPEVLQAVASQISKDQGAVEKKNAVEDEEEE
jgi:mannosidase alpha-like ER degradation enhancer 2